MCRAEGAARGFTLLEGVVALAILGALAVASLGAVGANLRATERAGRVLTATALAEDRLAASSAVDPAGSGRRGAGCAG